MAITPTRSTATNRDKSARLLCLCAATNCLLNTLSLASVYWTYYKLILKEPLPRLSCCSRRCPPSCPCATILVEIYTVKCYYIPENASHRSSYATEGNV